MTEASTGSGKGRTTPYGSWGTFNTVLDHLNAVGIPNLLDRNALPGSLSGASKSEMLHAFRFFELIDGAGRPNATVLPRLVDPTTRKEALIGLLKEYYSGLFALPLSTAGPTEINRWFTENASTSTVQRAKAFFVRAATTNGIAMHSMVVKSTKAAPSGGPKRRRKPKEKAEEGRTGDRADVIINPPLVEKLLDKFPDFDPSWDAEVQQKWFEGFSKLQDELKK